MCTWEGEATVNAPTCHGVRGSCMAGLSRRLVAVAGLALSLPTRMPRTPTQHQPRLAMTLPSSTPPALPRTAPAMPLWVMQTALRDCALPLACSWWRMLSTSACRALACWPAASASEVASELRSPSCASSASRPASSAPTCGRAGPQCQQHALGANAESQPVAWSVLMLMIPKIHDDTRNKQARWQHKQGMRRPSQLS